MFYLLLIVIGFIPAILFAQPFQWTTFTSTSDVANVTTLDGRVWMATTGGLSGYDPATGTFDAYTNTRGLAMNQCVVIGKDARGYVWVGAADGRITRVNPVTGDVKQIIDLQGEVLEMTAIVNAGDDVFVSGRKGIYHFAYYPIVDNYRVLESIKVLGSFPAETRVSSMAVSGNYLYAGTAVGLARARLDRPPISAPDAWSNFTTSNSGLVDNDVRALGVQDTTLWLALPTHLQVFDGTTFGTTAGLSGIFAFASNGSRFYSAAVFQVLVVDPHDPASWSNVGELFNRVTGITSVNIASEPTLVVGCGDTEQGRGGLSLFNNDLTNAHFTSALSAEGIGGNFISSVAVDPKGNLWVGGAGSNSGVYLREGDNWTNFVRGPSQYQGRFFRSEPRAIAFDDFGGTWLATEAGGVGWFHGHDYQIFDSADSSGFALVNGVKVPRLNGISGDVTYVETRVTRNSAGDIYITNPFSTAGHPLMRVSHDWIARGNNSDPWFYYLPKLSGQTDDYLVVENVVVDPLNRVWTGASRLGTRSFVLDDHATPNDTTDDRWFAYTPDSRQDAITCFEPLNKEVLTWAVDQQGYLWIGTQNGAYYAQGGVPYDLNQLRFICVVDLPVGRSVNSIHVDSQDNKWFGTDNGVAVLDKNFTWVNVFQTSNSVEHASDLVSNDVQTITSNPVTGEIWIGTTDGLSRFTSPYVTTPGGLSNVWPYPNPFRADGAQRMRLDPVRLGGRFDELRVYTISGRLVRKLKWADMTDPRASGGWDGRNEDQELVAGGVYLLLAWSADGQSSVGKVAVLGR